MDYAAARTYMLSLPEAEEDFPFYPDVAVMKVRGKMFATLAWEEGVARTNLKADPDHALFLRDFYKDAVIPGYHMNKRHWNTVILDRSIKAAEVKQMILESYRLVVKGLKKTQRQSLVLKYPEFHWE